MPLQAGVCGVHGVHIIIVAVNRMTKCFRIFGRAAGKGAPSHNLERLKINAITVLLIDGARVALYIYI